MKTYQLEERKREERVGEIRNIAHHKRGLTRWRGGRGRSGLVSFKMWHVINKDSPTGGEEEGEQVGGLRNMAGHKRGLPQWRGGSRRNGLVSFEKEQVKKDDSATRRRGKGTA